MPRNGGTDTIAFAIPGAGVHTISPVTALPNITQPVTIDGYTQSGSAVNTDPIAHNAVLLIELEGSASSAPSISLRNRSPAAAAEATIARSTRTRAARWRCSSRKPSISDERRGSLATFTAGGLVTAMLRMAFPTAGGWPLVVGSVDGFITKTFNLR